MSETTNVIWLAWYTGRGVGWVGWVGDLRNGRTGLQARVTPSAAGGYVAVVGHILTWPSDATTYACATFDDEVGAKQFCQLVLAQYAPTYEG